MNSSTSNTLTCVVDAIPASERSAHFNRIAALFNEVERRDVTGGYAFSLPPSSFAEIAHFIDNERRCCPFLEFSLRVPPEGAAIELVLTGPEGTRAFLDTELLRASGR